MSMFRKPGDSSSSEDDTLDTREETSVGAEDNLLSRINTLESTSSAPLTLQSGGPSPLNRPGISRTNTGNNVRDLLLHSLLEEKALTEAAEHLGKSKTDQEVIALAQQTYRGLVRQFPNQLDENYDSDEMRQQRATAKEGINRATRMHLTGLSAAATAAGTAAAAEVSQALVARPSFLDLPTDVPSPFSREIETLHDLYRQLPSSVQGHTAIHNNRYAREYEEIEMVGKGGYGKVYKVKHKLDNAFYAVKRIVIGANKLQKIRERGDEELRCILEEVRSLARFEHTNIVRYHGAWMEFTADVADMTISSTAKVTRPNRLLVHASEPSFSTGPADRMYESFGSLDIDDPFERAHLETAGYVHFEDSDTGAGADESKGQSTGAPMQEKGLKGKKRRGSQATIATVSSTKSRLSAVEDVDEEEDEDIETIPRTHEPTFEESESIATDTDAQNQLIAARIPGPALTLNVQMSLYSTNLAAFLSTEQEHPTHCFHPCISLELLNEVIKGVEYLHDRGVVHRDLKPANIFLSLSDDRRPPAGSVDLSSCCSCSGRKCVHVTPKIGDFGLVAALGDATTKPVGTEFYRPTIVSKISEKLDVFALGVVAFEMLHRFGTRMERVEALTKLRRGEFVEGFAAGCGDMEEELKGMIKGMMAVEDEKWSCEEVRKVIIQIVNGLKENGIEPNLPLTLKLSVDAHLSDSTRGYALIEKAL
ncbi:hypothetical protein N0V90_006778 [Kalmusia sp. IMI 367209]|nr:hypothetical protein N0V90_006778 [Kalmusia sp. IMI 367209]